MLMATALWRNAPRRRQASAALPAAAHSSRDTRSRGASRAKSRNTPRSSAGGHAARGVARLKPAACASPSAPLKVQHPEDSSSKCFHVS